MISTTLICLAVLASGFCIGLAWGTFKYDREIDCAPDINKDNNLR